MYACVDLGSNSFHLLIARWHDGAHEIVERFSEKVQLGEGLSQNCTINADAFQRGLVCLEAFALAMERYPIKYLWVVGTNALRVAENSQDFINQAKSRGFAVDVVTGLEEAALVYAGVTSAIPKDDQVRLVIDIGGGSTELIVGKGPVQLQAHSLPIGCVSWRDRWFSTRLENKDLLRKQLTMAADDAEQVFAQVADQLARTPWAEVFASSGTAKMLSAICSHKYPSAAGSTLVDFDVLAKLESDIIETTLNPGRTLPGLKNSRKELLLPGWAVLTGFMKVHQINKLHFSPAALREGMLHYMVKARDLNDSPLRVLRAS